MRWDAISQLSRERRDRSLIRLIPEFLNALEGGAIDLNPNAESVGFAPFLYLQGKHASYEEAVCPITQRSFDSLTSLFRCASGRLTTASGRLNDSSKELRGCSFPQS